MIVAEWGFPCLTLPVTTSEGAMDPEHDPAGRQADPAAQRDVPAVEQPGPAGQQDAPAVEQSGPAVHEQAGPAAQQPGPVAQQDAPAAEQPGPAAHEQSGPAAPQRDPAAQQANPFAPPSGPPLRPEDWAQPWPQGGAQQWPPPAGALPYPSAAPANHAATAALVCGCAGLLGSFIPFVNLISVCVAIAGVVCGFVGLSKARRIGVGKGLSIAGLVTGVVGIVLTVLMNFVVFNAMRDVVREYDKDARARHGAGVHDHERDESGDRTEEQARPKEKGKDGGVAALLGKDTVRAANGLEVTPAVPQAYTPGEYASGTGKFNYKVKFEFTNKGGKTVDLNLAMIQALSDGGETADITDVTGRVGAFHGGSLAPGQKASMTFGFSTEKAPTYVNLDVGADLPETIHFTHKF